MKSGPKITRRHGIGFAAGLMVAASGLADNVKSATAKSAIADGATDTFDRNGSLPADAIEKAIGAEGSFHHGVLSISIGRKDIGTVKGRMGVTFTKDFQIDDGFNIQPLPDGRAMVNGEMTVLPDEANAVIREIVAQGLTFQALHQHFMGEDPQVFHIHLRGIDAPIRLAEKLRKVVERTAAPLPQSKEKNPTSPLDHRRLAQILGGVGEISDGGMVHVMIPRLEQIRLGGVDVNPYLGVLTHVNFMPLDSAGKKVAVAPDYAMTAAEVDAVMRVSIRNGFDIGCLYNQETDEFPQLFFSHQLKVGDATSLARSVREALDQTAVRHLAALGGMSR